MLERAHWVLLVEDEPLVARSLMRRLAAHCSVEVVSTVYDAERAVRKRHWAGFLIDLRLPDGSGTSLLPAIRARQAHEPIVLMTGGDLTEASREALLARAMIVAKPLPANWFSMFGEWIAPPPPPATIMRERFAALGLSKREREVFSQLATGATAEMTALRLGLSAATVRSHCHHVYTRLGAGSLTEVLALANGIVSAERQRIAEPEIG
ncbi:MAG: response regulator transcription factor [Polyangiaceae bacterium]|nr:response regulator transcription factor [Polyangiaceae bacterium]